MSTRFEVVLTEEDTFVFQLRSENGELLLRSLGSSSKIMTQNEVQHLRKALRDPSRIEPHTASDGARFVVVKDDDGTVLARSRRAPSQDALEELVAVLVAAAGAPMVDLSKQRSNRAS